MSEYGNRSNANRKEQSFYEYGIITAMTDIRMSTEDKHSIGSPLQATRQMIYWRMITVVTIAATPPCNASRSCDNVCDFLVMLARTYDIAAVARATKLELEAATVVVTAVVLAEVLKTFMTFS